LEKYCTVEEATDDNTTRYIYFARRISKATNTHSEYLIFI
jgi:hypothetical protein